MQGRGGTGVEAIDEIVAEFLVESHENLDRLDRDLLALEQSPGSRELLAGVFRTIHTIKGTSGFLGFHRLEKLTHVGENLLSRLRDGKIALTDARSTALLELVDAVRGLLADIERTGGETEVDHRELLATLSALLEDGAREASAPPAPAPEPDHADEPAPLIGEILVQAGDVSQDDVDRARMQQQLGDDRPIGSILVEHGATTSSAVEDAVEAQAGTHRSVIGSSVRVDVELLDSLMRLVGELVLARNQLLSRLEDEKGAAEDSSLARSAQRVSLVTSELQEQVMKTRMQPVDAVWSKMPRVVRDLARTCGKQVRLEMEGRETELDRSALEAIKEALTHLVRNAVDHGIEDPQVRVAAGKPAEGVLTLRACHEAGQVRIEISEDGAGIDPQRIAATALERGLVSRQQLATMSHRDLLGFVFLPGFSTAAQVTNVSGRGVGMDVVKTRIEAIGGSVDVTSSVGRGSTFRLAIPLILDVGGESRAA
jgi:two-component system, chemotaxis family, sensor kinase CheA